jgi:hypothetical protein
MDLPLTTVGMGTAILPDATSERKTASVQVGGRFCRRQPLGRQLSGM